MAVGSSTSTQIKNKATTKTRKATTRFLERNLTSRKIHIGPNTEPRAATPLGVIPAASELTPKRLAVCSVKTTCSTTKSTITLIIQTNYILISEAFPSLITKRCHENCFPAVRQNCFSLYKCFVRVFEIFTSPCHFFLTITTNNYIRDFFPVKRLVQSYVYTSVP